VVIGGGIGGLAAAAGLHAAGWDVTRCERAASLDGRWLLRSSTEHMIVDRFGDPVILLPRSSVIEALVAHVPSGVL
jgi:phytoene dehydrogenase-like protein